MVCKNYINFYIFSIKNSRFNIISNKKKLKKKSNFISYYNFINDGKKYFLVAHLNIFYLVPPPSMGVDLAGKISTHMLQFN
jgi:hypothetical protein